MNEPTVKNSKLGYRQTPFLFAVTVSVLCGVKTAFDGKTTRIQYFNIVYPHLSFTASLRSNASCFKTNARDTKTESSLSREEREGLVHVRGGGSSVVDVLLIR
jgi:hypothetical protein